jgi:hypothetical protein
MQPSEQLVAAADLIRDLAAKASTGAWKWRDPGGHIKYALMADRQIVVPSAIPDVYPSAGDARWIAAVSPALGSPIETILRWAAKVCSDVEADGWDRERIWAEMDDPMRAALDLAEAVLGSGVDTPRVHVLGDAPSGGPTCICDDAPACDDDRTDCPYRSGVDTP